MFSSSGLISLGDIFVDSVASPLPEGPVPASPGGGAGEAAEALLPEDRLHALGERILSTATDAASRATLLERLSACGRDLRLCNDTIRDDKQAVIMAVTNQGGE